MPAQKKRSLASTTGGSYSHSKNYAHYEPTLSYESKRAASNLFPNLPKHEFDEYIGRRLNNEVDEKDRRLNYLDRLYRTYEANVLKTKKNSAKNSGKNSSKIVTAELGNGKRSLRNHYPATSYEKKLKHRVNEYGTQRQKADNIAKLEKTKAKNPKRKLWSWDKPRTITKTYEKSRYEKIILAKRNADRVRMQIRDAQARKMTARKLTQSDNSDKYLKKKKIEKKSKENVRAASRKKQENDKKYKYNNRKLDDDKLLEKKVLIKANKAKSLKEIREFREERKQKVKEEEAEKKKIKKRKAKNSRKLDETDALFAKKWATKEAKARVKQLIQVEKDRQAKDKAKIKRQAEQQKKEHAVLERKAAKKTQDDIMNEKKRKTEESHKKVVAYVRKVNNEKKEKAAYEKKHSKKRVLPEKTILEKQKIALQAKKETRAQLRKNAAKADANDKKSKKTAKEEKNKKKNRILEAAAIIAAMPKKEQKKRAEEKEAFIANLRHEVRTKNRVSKDKKGNGKPKPLPTVVDAEEAKVKRETKQFKGKPRPRANDKTKKIKPRSSLNKKIPGRNLE